MKKKSIYNIMQSKNGRKGGLTTFERHGSKHMSTIAKKRLPKKEEK